MMKNRCLANELKLTSEQKELTAVTEGKLREAEKNVELAAATVRSSKFDGVPRTGDVGMEANLADKRSRRGELLESTSTSAGHQDVMADSIDVKSRRAECHRPAGRARGLIASVSGVVTGDFDSMNAELLELGHVDAPVELARGQTVGFVERQLTGGSADCHVTSEGERRSVVEFDAETRNTAKDEKMVAEQSNTDDVPFVAGRGSRHDVDQSGNTTLLGFDVWNASLVGFDV